MMAPLRWGIAGCGKISNDFAASLTCLSTDDHQLVSVAARSLESAKTFAESFDVQNFYGNYEDLAKDSSVDVVYIGAVNSAHFGIAMLMLNHGKHVLCEKSLCMNEKQAKKLLDHAKAKKLFCMEAVWSRFFPSYAYLKQRINNGDLGEIIEVEVSLGVDIPNYENFADKATGRGSILDIAVYPIQLSQLAFKVPPISISASGKISKEGVDLDMSGILKYPNGGVAYIKSSGIQNLDNSAVIKGTEGSVKLENFWCATSIVDIDGKVKDFDFPQIKKGKLNYFKSDGLCYQAAETKRCIEQGLLESPGMSHQESLLFAHIEDEIRRQLGVVYPVDSLE